MNLSLISVVVYQVAFNIIRRRNYSYFVSQPVCI